MSVLGEAPEHGCQGHVRGDAKILSKSLNLAPRIRFERTAFPLGGRSSLLCGALCCGCC